MKKANPGKFFLTWNLLFYFTLYHLIDDYSAIPSMERWERKLSEIIKVVIKPVRDIVHLMMPIMRN